MNILVYDVAAESGGATSVLNYFYEQHKKDKSNHYYYLLSTYELKNADNITVINEPMVKKSWLHRIVFDYIGTRKYIKEYEIEQIISLQNIVIPGFKGEQTVYMHNALPFSEYRFSLREDPKLWIYQNIIGQMIKKSILKADKVIVQADWLKYEIERQIPKSQGKIEVSFPKVEILDDFKYQQQKKKVFFYPANGSRFKNHELIYEACCLLKQQGIGEYEVVLTLQGDESKNIKRLFEMTLKENMNFKWMGMMTREEVFHWYGLSILIFPSYIETIGLPIYEAMSIGAPILLADCLYSKSVAKDYDAVQYFDYKDANKLAELMKKIILGSSESS